MGGCVWEGAFACVPLCESVCGCVGVQVSRSNTEGRGACLCTACSNGSRGKRMGQSSSFWQKESGLEVRLAISPGVVLDSAAGVGCKRQVWELSRGHSAHSAPCSPSAAVGRSGCAARPLPVLPGDYQQSVSQSPSSVLCLCVLSGTGRQHWPTRLACLHVQQFGFQSGQFSLDVGLNMPAASSCFDGTVSLGNPLNTARDNRYCAVGDLHWV